MRGTFCFCYYYLVCVKSYKTPREVSLGKYCENKEKTALSSSLLKAAAKQSERYKECQQVERAFLGILSHQLRCLRLRPWKNKSSFYSSDSRGEPHSFICDLNIEDHLPANMQPADSGGQNCSRERIKRTLKKKKMLNCLVVETENKNNKKNLKSWLMCFYLTPMTTMEDNRWSESFLFTPLWASWHTFMFKTCHLG